MSRIPATTRPSPDQARLRSVMRRVAEVESVEAPVLSVYLDLRPAGDEPARRSGLVILRDRLNEIAGTYRPRSPGRSSLDADADRLWRMLDEDESLRSVHGLAVFACHAAGLWETVSAPVPFQTQVSSGPTADLFQLAGLLDDSEASVVALVDTNTCRLFVTLQGSLVERPGPDEPPDEHRRHDQGGWSQARFQRHIDMQDKRFANEAAEAIERLVDEVNAQHLILAGDERSLSALQPELTARIAALIRGVERINLDVPPGEVETEVAPLLAAIRVAEEEEAANRVVAGVRAGGLALSGIDRVAEALERGQVDELVLNESAPLDGDLRAELVRMAALTSAEVVVVRDHQALLALGGVGATLRWRG